MKYKKILFFNFLKDEVVEVLKGVILTSNEICALIVGESCGSQITPNMHWNIQFPPIPKPPFAGYPEPKVFDKLTFS